MPKSANLFKMSLLKTVHHPVWVSNPDISNLRCSFINLSLSTCLNCCCNSSPKERRCLIRLKTSSFVICFKLVISILFINSVKVLPLFCNKRNPDIFLLFIFRLIVLKTSGYIVASVMSQNEKEEILFGISSFSSYKKD